jgi:hypothetical protein
VPSGCQTDHAGVEAVEAVMAAGFTGIATADASLHPRHARATTGPPRKRFDTRGLREAAAVLAVMDDEGRRQCGRRSENRSDVLVTAGFVGQET